MDEDIKYLVYLFFVLIYIISRAFKKKKAPRRNAPVNTETTEQQPETTVTFEDLLKEFGADIPRKESKPPPPIKPVTIPDDQYAQEVYRKSIESAKSEKPLHSALSERSKRMKFERDEHYRITEQSNPLAEKLKNPETLVDAIIYSEILNRKYD